jgi:hypothetical protein
VQSRESRRTRPGTPWRSDPQQVVDEAPTWWWNPLSYVTDDTTAAKLAGHFAAGSREPGDKGDAFFDPAGKDLLAGMLLAASLDRRPITDVFGWLTDPDNREMVAIYSRSSAMTRWEWIRCLARPSTVRPALPHVVMVAPSGDWPFLAAPRPKSLTVPNWSGFAPVDVGSPLLLCAPWRHVLERLGRLDRNGAMRLISSSERRADQL